VAIAVSPSHACSRRVPRPRWHGASLGVEHHLGDRPASIHHVCCRSRIHEDEYYYSFEHRAVQIQCPLGPCAGLQSGASTRSRRRQRAGSTRVEPAAQADSLLQDSTQRADLSRAWLHLRHVGLGTGLDRDSSGRTVTWCLPSTDDLHLADGSDRGLPSHGRLVHRHLTPPPSAIADDEGCRAIS